LTPILAWDYRGGNLGRVPKAKETKKKKKAVNQMELNEIFCIIERVSN